jgi:anti-sigma factor RsiW
MSLDREVLLDLLPLYLAGEASPATRAVVEEAMAADPELARLAREAAASDNALAGALRAVAPTPSAEKLALRKTRRLLRRRSWLLGFAIFFSLLPFSVAGSSEGISFPMLEGPPAGLAIVGIVAIGLWGAYLRTSRRLAVTGL